ncbi:hypothetical protein C9422_10575 [Pseudomonas sp. B1(2018)]|nr:hypothetical protein C9422_10575 [Pseudomonas sp. B1(2018)]
MHVIFSAGTVPCRSCRRLRSFDLERQHQKIAACGSSYRVRAVSEQLAERDKPRSVMPSSTSVFVSSSIIGRSWLASERLPDVFHGAAKSL